MQILPLIGLFSAYGTKIVELFKINLKKLLTFYFQLVTMYTSTKQTEQTNELTNHRLYNIYTNSSYNFIHNKIRNTKMRITQLELEMQLDNLRSYTNNPNYMLSYEHDTNKWMLILFTSKFDTENLTGWHTGKELHAIMQSYINISIAEKKRKQTNAQIALNHFFYDAEEFTSEQAAEVLNLAFESVNKLTNYEFIELLRSKCYDIGVRVPYFERDERINATLELVELYKTLNQVR